MSEKVPEKKKRGSSLKKLLQNSFFGSSTSKDKKRHETAVVPNAARVKTKSVPGSYQGHDPHCGDSYHFNRKLVQRHTIGSNERNFYPNQNVMYMNHRQNSVPSSPSPLQQLPNMYFKQIDSPQLFDDKNCPHYGKPQKLPDFHRQPQMISNNVNRPTMASDMYGTVFDNLSPIKESHEHHGQSVYDSAKQSQSQSISDYGWSTNSNRNMNFVRDSPERVTIGPVVNYQNVVYQNQYLDMYENMNKKSQNVPLTTNANVNGVKTTSNEKRRFQRSHSFSSNESSSIDDETYRNYMFRKRNFAQKKVVINNKYCDTYGRIHETSEDGLMNNSDSSSFVSTSNKNFDNNPQEDNYGQIKKVGVIYGQINFNATNNFKKSDRCDSVSLQSSDCQFVETAEESKDEVDDHKVAVISKQDDDWKNNKSETSVPNSNKASVNNGENNESKTGNRVRNAVNRREEPRRHTLTYSGQQSNQNATIRTMELESMRMRNGYLMPNNSAMFDEDPGIMSEVETSSTGFRRGNKQRSSLPVVRTPNKTLERPLGLVFLQYHNETKRALLPNEITSIATVRALFVRSFSKQLTMEYLDSPLVKIYMHDPSKDMFFELEDSRIHLRDIKDRSVLRIFEANDVTGGLPRPGIGIAATIPHVDDPSYFSEPEFDSEFQHQHIHKSKIGIGKNQPPYYVGGSAKTLPRNTTLFRTYSTSSTDRLKSHSNHTDGYMSSPERNTRGTYDDPYYTHYTNRANTMTPVIDEEASDTEVIDDSYAMYGAKIAPATTGSTPASVGPRNGTAPRALFPKVPYDSTRMRVEQMERQLANLTGLVQKALTQPQSLTASRDNFRDETDMYSNSSTTSVQDDLYANTNMNDNRNLSKLKNICHKSVSFEKSVSFSDEPPDEKSQKQHSPQHFTDTKPTKSAIKSSTLPRMSSQDKDHRVLSVPVQTALPFANHLGAYRELQITPEIYNQLRCLQKKTKDMRSELRDLRRLAQAQTYSVCENIRETFIKIRTMILVRGDDVLRSAIDQEKLRLNREEDLYKQEILHLEKDLSDLELTVEELRTDVINRKTRVNIFDVENMALVLTRSSKTVADLKLKFPMLHDGIKMLLNCEMEKVVREEKFLKEEPDRLENALRRCKKLTGTLVTMKRLASVQEQRLPCQNNFPGDLMHLENGLSHSPINHNNRKEFTANDNLGQNEAKENDEQPMCSDTENSSRQENALDALLNELQTFSRPNDNNNNLHNENQIQNQDTNSSLVAEIGKKFDSTTEIVSDSNNNNTSSTTKRTPPPPPPRTSSKSPALSPTSEPEKVDEPTTILSQFELAKQNLGLTVLKRGLVTKKAQTLPRNSTETVLRQGELETRHQELLKRQKVLQEQYLKLQNNNSSDLIKKTGSESNILQKFGIGVRSGLQLAPNINPNTEYHQNKIYETDIL